MGANDYTEKDDEYRKLCGQENLIHRYFKTTCEPYDELDFDGEELKVWLDGEIIERYPRKCLEQLIDGFPEKPETFTP